MSDKTIGNGTLKQHRWVMNEPQIPFSCEQLYCDDNLMVVDKPHFLASMPRGMWYRQTALIQMREKTGNEELSLAHRLDRATAGVLVMTTHKSVRGAYQKLFESRAVHKMYECVASDELARALVNPRRGEQLVQRLNEDGMHRAQFVAVHEGEDARDARRWGLQLSSHIEKTVGIFQAAELGLGDREDADAVGGSDGADGVNSVSMHSVNATTLIAVKPQEQLSEHEKQTLASNPHMAIYQLWPRTGKTHQLRVHMNALNCPMLGDDLYPTVIDRAYDDFSSPLALVARRMRFTDPLTGEERVFHSQIEL
ncbi:pseudouridine synthase [Aeriscardovia aeriphila]|uniref:RNA pseudouridylate synthase n=1 Tax=Aeriscardovia aeriphila TaxID=218139 RepID=A0A261FBD0_9BIFI|nr:pseudouridine synthase [Aeriscardovia aeriphila]NYI25438.1 tRNA pseudouridine32 synthase/23S rRNA pseudouridine746 synthase [Aeriscardovia aeriphila]OZG56408.1 RNA pseudouridine synthase [Aeriscardovia aeriphila]